MDSFIQHIFFFGSWQLTILPQDVLLPNQYVLLAAWWLRDLHAGWYLVTSVSGDIGDS